MLWSGSAQFHGKLDISHYTIVHPANDMNFMQHVDISKPVSAVSQQLHLVAEFQLKECAGIIIGIAALNRVTRVTHTDIRNVHASLILWVS